jgi:hypothetical protein
MKHFEVSLLCSIVVVLVVVQVAVGAPEPEAKAKASPEAEPTFYGNGWNVASSVSLYPRVSLYPIFSVYPVNPWNGWGGGWRHRDGGREGSLRVYGR